MRIVKSEKIILSQNESDTWLALENILSGLARETQNINTERAILRVRILLNELWEQMNVEVE